MTNKLPTITLNSNETNIVIKQNSVNVEKAYDISVKKKNYSHTIACLSLDELKTLSQAIELYLTIVD